MTQYFREIFIANPFDGAIPILTFIAFVAVALLLVVAFRREPYPKLEMDMIKVVGLYIIWGMFQQFILVSTFHLMVHIFKLEMSILLSAMIFGFVCHFSNRLLMAYTFGMALVFLSHFSFYHNFYILGFAHGVIATIFEYVVPSNLTERMRVWSR